MLYLGLPNIAQVDSGWRECFWLYYRNYQTRLSLFSPLANNQLDVGQPWKVRSL